MAKKLIVATHSLDFVTARQQESSECDVVSNPALLCGKHYDVIEVRGDLSYEWLEDLKTRLSGPGAVLLQTRTELRWRWPKRA